eukprot:1009134-Amphidinium_carterae.1
MRSHQTAQQAEAAGLPAAYLAGNAAADLLAGSAVQDVPALPPTLSLFRRAAAAARSFWSLFASACPSEHLIQEDQVSHSRKPSFSRVASLFAPREADTSSPMRGRVFYSHLAGEDGSSILPAQHLPSGGGAADSDLLATLPDQEGVVMSGVVDTGCNLDVRVDESMDRNVPVVAEDPEVFGTAYRVGPHTCHLTAGDTRMTCKKCGRYVTSYKGTWRNLGTIAKQPCKPKARRLKGYEGKAAHKQSGGALPAPPPGSRPRGRAPGPNKKARTTASKELVTPFSQAALSSEVQRQPAQETVSAAVRAEEPGGSSGRVQMEEPGGSSEDHAKNQCALCRGHVPGAGAPRTNHT